MPRKKVIQEIVMNSDTDVENENKPPKENEEKPVTAEPVETAESANVPKEITQTPISEPTAEDAPPAPKKRKTAAKKEPKPVTKKEPKTPKLPKERKSQVTNEMKLYQNEMKLRKQIEKELKAEQALEKKIRKEYEDRAKEEQYLLEMQRREAIRRQPVKKVSIKKPMKYEIPSEDEGVTEPSSELSEEEDIPHRGQTRAREKYDRYSDRYDHPHRETQSDNGPDLKSQIFPDRF